MQSEDEVHQLLPIGQVYTQSFSRNQVEGDFVGFVIAIHYMNLVCHADAVKHRLSLLEKLLGFGLVSAIQRIDGSLEQTVGYTLQGTA